MISAGPKLILTVLALSFSLAVIGCQTSHHVTKNGGTSALSDAPLFSSSSGTRELGSQPYKASKIGVGGAVAPGEELDLLAGVKDGLERVGELLTFTEPVHQAPDPTSLSTKAKPSPRLYVAMARLAEDAKQPQNAEQHYQKALQLDANYLDALLGMGRLKDRQGALEEALSYYSKAVKAHPDSPVAWNHLGLCYARLGRSREAIQALEKAATLAPKEPRYRHNLATVLVQIGDLATALKQLSAVHDEATACYNLGYLLVKKGDTVAALRYFNRSIELRPNFADAIAWRDALVNRHGINPQVFGEQKPTSTVGSLAKHLDANSEAPSVGSAVGRVSPPSDAPLQPMPAPLPPLEDATRSPISAETGAASVVLPLPPVF